MHKTSPIKTCGNFRRGFLSTNFAESLQEDAGTLPQVLLITGQRLNGKYLYIYLYLYQYTPPYSQPTFIHTASPPQRIQNPLGKDIKRKNRI